MPPNEIYLRRLRGPHPKYNEMKNALNGKVTYAKILSLSLAVMLCCAFMATARMLAPERQRQPRIVSDTSDSVRVPERPFRRLRGIKERPQGAAVRIDLDALKNDTSDTPDSDADGRPKLVIPDSLRALYKFTDGLKRAAVYGDSVESRRLYEEALAEDSLFAPALYELASQYMESDPARAVDYARRAYAADTMSRWYMSLYAQTLIVAGRYDEAAPLYRRLMRIDGKNPDNYRIMAMLYQQKGQPYLAITILDSADMRFGKINYLSNLKRMLLIATRQFDRAIDEAREAVDEAPYEQGNVLSLGEAYAAAGRDSLADVTLRRAVEMDSTNVEAVTVYADFCSKRGDMAGYLAALKRLFALDDFPLDRKVDLFRRLTADRNFYGEHFFRIGSLASTLAIRYPSDKRAVDIYGDHLLAGGNVESALQHFKLHLADEPPQMDYYMAVIDIEDYLQHPDSVDRYVQRAVELFPDDPVLYIRKANRRYVKGDYKGAIDTFTEALRLAPTDSLRGQLWGFIGDTYHQMSEAAAGRDTRRDSAAPPAKIGMSAKAAAKRCYQAYEKALAYRADNASVLNNYAYYISEEGRDLERALEMSSRAIELEQNNATFIDTYAWILYKLGRYEEARKSMRQALSLDTTGSAALPLHYGDILYELGEKFMAETYWRKALEAGGDAAEIEARIERLKGAPEPRKAGKNKEKR